MTPPPTADDTAKGFTSINFPPPTTPRLHAKLRFPLLPNTEYGHLQTQLRVDGGGLGPSP